MGHRVTYAPTPKSTISQNRFSALDERSQELAKSSRGSTNPFMSSTYDLISHTRQKMPEWSLPVDRPTFDKTIADDDWKRPAVAPSHAAYMRDDPTQRFEAHAHPQVTAPSEADHYTCQLRRAAQEQRRKRESQQGREVTNLAQARAARQTKSAKPSRRAPYGEQQHQEVFVQGMLASEIGLVAPAASRRGPIIRPKEQDLELAGCAGSVFGNVSRKLHEEQEKAQRDRAARACEYQRDIIAQASHDRLKKIRNKEQGINCRKLDSELLHLEREKLIEIRDAKLRQLKVAGVGPEHRAHFARMPL